MFEFEDLGTFRDATAAVALLMAASLALGTLFSRTIAAGSRSVTDRLLLQLVVGLHLLGLLGVAVGSTGILTQGRSIWLLLACTSLLLPQLWSLRPLPRIANLVQRPNASQLTVAAVACGLGLITLGPALCYPTAWDELVYHQVLPLRWMADGWPAVYIDLPYSGFPSMGALLFWLMAPVDCVIAPRLLIWVCWIIGLACTYRVLRRIVRSESAAALALFVAMNETMLLISANCYVESIQWMSASALLLAMTSFPGTSHSDSQRQEDCRPRFGWRQATLLGCLAAGPAAIKLTGGGLLALPCLWYLTRSRSKRPDWRSAAGLAAISAGASLVMLFPFYLRPWRATGNPFYPYLAEWFTRDPVCIEVSRFHHAIGGLEFGVRSLAAFIDAPLLLAFREVNYDGRFGWQLIGLVILAVMALVRATRSRRARLAVWPAAASLWLYVFWFLTAQQARFAVLAIAAFVPLAAWGLRLTHGRARRLVVACLFAASLASLPWTKFEYYRVSWLAAVGQMRRADYAHNLTGLTYLPTVQAIEAYTPRDARLMLLFEHRSFYIPRRCVIGSPLFQAGPFSPPQQFNSAVEIMRVLQQEGISHVVMTKAPAGPDHTPDSYEREQLVVNGLQECVKTGKLTAVWECDTHVLLRVNLPANRE
jgi:hypothetical protein